jgi:hypothetical protein
MREALNNNPVVQIAVIGVLVLVVGLFFMMNMKKGSGSSSSSSESSAASTSVVPGTTSPTTVSPDGTAAAAPSASGSISAPAPTAGTVSPDALVPGPGLPAPVVKAWKGGAAVVLLVVRGGGVDDRLVRRSVQWVSGDGGVSVFVTRAKDVARYSRITQGVGVTQAPALVVVRPRRESGSVPQAQVSYGFRNAQSVVQAVDDALYSGRDDLPYYPR